MPHDSDYDDYEKFGYVREDWLVFIIPGALILLAVLARGYG